MPISRIISGNTETLCDKLIEPTIISMEDFSTIGIVEGHFSACR